MPIGYLVTATLLAVSAIIAVRPPKPATSSPSSWVFSTTCVVNELPFVAAYWLVASTGLAVVQGDLFTPVGLVGCGVALVALAAAIVIARRGLAARSALIATLDGTSDVSGRDASGRMSPRHRWWPILAAPLAVRGRHVRREANISYGPAGRRNLLDVYHRRTERVQPVLVYFHGGAFRSGHKNREGKPLVQRFARRGWVCVSANYRLAPDAHFPDHLIDAKRVIAWARHNAERYGGDPSRIFVAGSSAGGHLATMAALTPNRPEFQPDFIDDDTAVTAAIGLYGFYGAASADPTSTPHAYIHAAAPPMFLAHGDNDTLVLIDDARAFANALGAVSSQPVVFAELPGAQHGFDIFRSARSEAVVDAIEVFAAIDPTSDASGGRRVRREGE